MRFPNKSYPLQSVQFSAVQLQRSIKLVKRGGKQSGCKPCWWKGGKKERWKEREKGKIFFFFFSFLEKGNKSLKKGTSSKSKTKSLTIAIKVQFTNTKIQVELKC